MTVQMRGGGALATLAHAFGGDVYAGGRRALLPAPGHSAADRSVSLWLRDGRVIVKSFGGADWREILDELRDRGWIDSDNRLLSGGVPCASAAAPVVEATRAERIAAAHRIWDRAGPIAQGSPAGQHLLRRGVALVARDVASLRAHGSVPAGVYRDAGPFRPALVAAVTTATGDVTAVEIAYLDARGRRSATARPSRKVVGVLPPGCAVRLADVTDEMLVAEGVFTTLSAMGRFGLPGWALLSTSNLRRWQAPAGVRRVLIAADRGTDGERSAETLRLRLVRVGVEVLVVLPPVGYGDWNDLDREE